MAFEYMTVDEARDRPGLRMVVVGGVPSPWGEAGSGFYVGDRLTAVGIYGATAMALYRPLPQEQCEMRNSTRAAFELRDDETDAVLDPVLFEHRDRIYRDYLELPLSL